MQEQFLFSKNYLTAFSYFVLAEKLKDKHTAVVFDTLADFYTIKNTFLEIKNVFSCCEKFDDIELLFLYTEGDKLSYDSVIDLTKLSSVVESNKRLCLLLQKNVLEHTIVDTQSNFFVEVNKSIDFDKLLSKLVDFGYKRVNYIETIGEFAVRGNIIDIWPNGFFVVENVENGTKNFVHKKVSYPLRIVLEEQNVSQIKLFDVSTQRSISYQKISSVEIYPIKLQQKSSQGVYIKDFLEKNRFYTIICSENFLSNKAEIYNDIQYSMPNKYYGQTEVFKKDIDKFLSEGYKVFIGYNYESQFEKIVSLIGENTYIKLLKTNLTSGLCSNNKKIFFITYSEIFSQFQWSVYPKQEIYHGIRLENIWEIQPDDFVVHRDFGIAKFLGIKSFSIHGYDKEFLTLKFADDAILYVPMTEIDSVEKYISLSNKPPKLSYLNRESWQKTTKKIKDSIKEFIAQLYNLYTQRKNLSGIKFGSDEQLEKMFAETFEYEETEDQKKVIEDVLSDMNKEYPMDRIVVGDVGFGKTEVALRATFRAVLNKRQVLVLCPTTVLAEQHYRTFSSRLESFSIKVAILTRLQSKQYLSDMIKKISDGEIDVIIGTHILLNDNIKFNDLGLVVIDEEHKFGVNQKEKIRLKYRNFVNENETMPDVLSLTATPIPRTLAFGLEGIKDISVIETPPEGRLPIETYILPYNENYIVEAISRELHRGGQVYYVFNDTSLIEHKTNKIKSYFPEANIEFIHSKLPAKKIEEIMIRFVQEKIQILVSTTIIESGLDIPNVNTIIIEKVENFGLAQLYQLRGRVGRREKKAYCYLFYSPENLTLNAKKRLAALKEFTTLGSGYRLALRDLEIRGAGEILGTKQHGFVNEIGLSMYSKIVQQIVNEMSGYEYEEVVPKIELEIDAAIPNDYIQDEEERLVFYRKLIEAKTITEIENVKEEMEDRFGKCLHKDELLLKNLFLISKLRVVLKKYNVLKISSKKTVDGFEISTMFKNYDKIPLLLQKFHTTRNSVITECNKNKLVIITSLTSYQKCFEKIVELFT
jgi:transcription-repair coupling factor (superfamily II helicase)